MNTTESILEFRKKLNNINNALINYATWIKDLDITEIKNVKEDYLNKLNLIVLQTKLSNSTTFLNELSCRLKELDNSFLSDINNINSTIKITEFNKFSKDLSKEVESIKDINKNDYDSIKQEIETLSKELNDKLGVDNIITDFKNDVNNVEIEINKKIESLNIENSKSKLDELVNEQTKLTLKINNLNSKLENFDDEILSSVSANKKLSKLINDAEMYALKHNIKSNLNPNEYDEYLNIKQGYYETLKKYNDYIYMQAINLANEISDMFSVDAIKFNDNWATILSKKDNLILSQDKVEMEKIIKDTNNKIDNLSKKYGAFIDNIYKDYAKYLTDLKFDLKKK